MQQTTIELNQSARVEDLDVLDSIEYTQKALGGVCTATVWNLISAGDLETVKIRNRRMVKRRSRIALVENGTPPKPRHPKAA